MLQQRSFSIWDQSIHIYSILLKLIKIRCCTTLRRLVEQILDIIFFSYFNPLLPTHSPRSPCIVKHFCSPSPLTRDKPARLWPPWFSLSHRQEDSAAAATFSRCMRNAGMNHAQIFHVSCRPSGCRLALVKGRGCGGDRVIGPSSSWQPPKGEFLERRRTFCSLAKSFRSGRGRRASLNKNCSCTKVVDER